MREPFSCTASVTVRCASAMRRLAISEPAGVSQPRQPGAYPPVIISAVPPLARSAK